MKKFVILLFCLSFLLSGCQTTDNKNETKPEDFAIGVIRTISSRDSSDILYFNENLEQVGSTHYKYATMGQLFYSSVIFDNALYIIPQGRANEKNEKTILQQDLETFEHKEYHLDQVALYGISVDLSAIYVANNLNHQSFISRIGKDDNAVKTSTFDDAFVSSVYVYDGVLYAFVDENLSHEKTSKLYCLNPDTLEEINEIDISDLGCTVYSVLGSKDTLYFIPVETLKGEFNHIIGTYNIKTGDVNMIDFPYITHHILNVGDKLYATHGNLVTGEGSKLSVYQIGSGEIATYDLGMWPGQIAVYNNSLYVMGNNQIGKYDLQTLEKQSEVDVPLETGYYLSEIFSRPYSK